MHKSQYLWWGCVAAIVAIAQFPTNLIIIAALGTLLWLVLKHQSNLWQLLVWTGFCLVGFGLGLWRWQTPINIPTQLQFQQVVQFKAMVTQPPSNDGAEQKVYVLPSNWPGAVYLKTEPYPRWQYGDIIQVQCTLQQPGQLDDFDFASYLKRYGAIAVCTRPIITATGERQGNIILRTIYDWRSQLRTTITAVWSQPTAGIVAGLLIGLQDDISANVTQQFRRAGVIHILVVSGMHVVILSQLLIQLCQRFLPRRYVIVAVAGALVVLCVITGLAASVIRASVMGLFPLLAHLLQRRNTFHHTIVIIVAGMVLWNPWLLRYDMGFQLSFLATIGLIYFQPLTDRWVWFIPQWFGMREVVATTLAATITTTPLLLSVFGTFALIGPVANLIVVPVSNIILFASAGVLLVQAVVPAWTNLLAYPVQWLTVSLVQVVDWCSAVSWSNVTITGVSQWFEVIAYSLILIIIIWRVQHDTV